MPVIPIVTCENCPQRCDNNALEHYPQEQYYVIGENQEAEIMALVQSKVRGIFTCQKSANWGQAHTKPDLELKLIGLPSKPSKVVARLEVKHIRRAWMRVENNLKAPLVPWETIAVNTAKIRRYAKLHDEENIPIHLVWRVDRACLPGKYFYQDIRTLKAVVDQYGEKREFKRKGEDGDRIAFHYSVNELKPFDVDTYLNLFFSPIECDQQNGLVSDEYSYSDYEFTDADAPPEFGD